MRPVTRITIQALSVIRLQIVNADPSASYIFKGAEGLGPPDREVTISKGVFQAAAPQDKEIVLKIGLNPDYEEGETVAELRQELYRLLTPSQPNGSVNIVFVDDLDPLDIRAACSTQAWVRRMEPAIFEQNPGVQITFATGSPYFVGEEVDVHVGLDKAAPVIENDGSAPTGLLFKLQMTGPSDNWEISRPFTDEKISFEYDFATGDVLTIFTEEDRQFVNLQRGETPINMLPYMSNDSSWIQLFGGENEFETSHQLFNWQEVSYTARYWGI